MATLHGPMLRAFAEPSSPDMLTLFQRLVEACDPSEIPLDGEVVAQGHATGMLFGGNLAVLHAQLGLPWFPSLYGKILFIEEVNEPPYRIDRMLTHLADLGVLKQLAGLIVGDLGTGDPQWERHMVHHVTHECNYPVIVGCSIGHPMPIISLPIGVEAQWDTRKNRLCVAPLVQI
jgi:muramoyltetrapeptide carboxypeptidase